MKNEILRRQGRDIFVQQTALRIIYSVKSTSVNVHRSRMISLTNRIEAHCKKNSFAVGGTIFKAHALENINCIFLSLSDEIRPQEGLMRKRGWNFLTVWLHHISNSFEFSFET